MQNPRKYEIMSVRKILKGATAMQITYRQTGDYLLPELTLSNTQKIGKYGIMRKEYLQNTKRALYNKLLIQGELTNHLAEIEQQALEEIARLEAIFAQAEDLTEEMKNANPLAWVQRTNQIHKQAEEIVLREIILM